MSGTALIDYRSSESGRARTHSHDRSRDALRPESDARMSRGTVNARIGGCL